MRSVARSATEPCPRPGPCTGRGQHGDPGTDAASRHETAHQGDGDGREQAQQGTCRPETADRRGDEHRARHRRAGRGAPPRRRPASFRWRPGRAAGARGGRASDTMATRLASASRSAASLSTCRWVSLGIGTRLTAVVTSRDDGRGPAAGQVGDDVDAAQRLVVDDRGRLGCDRDLGDVAEAHLRPARRVDPHVAETGEVRPRRGSAEDDDVEDLGLLVEVPHDESACQRRGLATHVARSQAGLVRGREVDLDVDGGLPRGGQDVGALQARHGGHGLGDLGARRLHGGEVLAEDAHHDVVGSAGRGHAHPVRRVGHQGGAAHPGTAARPRSIESLTDW